AIAVVGGDRELLEEIVNDSLSELPELLAGLESAVDTENSAEARRYAHTVKASARTFSIPDLMDASEKLEQAAATGELAKVRERLPEFRRTMERVIAELSRHLD